MGWNGGYTIFEFTVIGAYNLGKLDEALLAVLMEPYRGTDIDAGGSHGLKTKDGKGVEQVVVETFGGEWLPPLDEDASGEEEVDWHIARAEAFDHIARDRFGWE